MPRAPSLADWLILAALTALWGSAFMLNELALAALPPVVLVAGRMLIGLAVLAVALPFVRGHVPRGARAWAVAAAMAVLGAALPFFLIAEAQRHITSSAAAILMAVMPLFVLTLSHYFVAGARLTAARVAGFVTGFAGVVLVIGPGGASALASGAGLLGALLTLAAALSYAVSAIVARRFVTDNAAGIATAMMLVSALLTTPFALGQRDAVGTVTPTAAAAVIALGALCTGLATLLYFRLVRGPGPAFLSLVNYFVPGWAVVLGAGLLGETIEPRALLGLATILGGVAVSEFGPRAARALRRRVGRGVRDEVEAARAPGEASTPGRA